MGLCEVVQEVAVRNLDWQSVFRKVALELPGCAVDGSITGIR